MFFLALDSPLVCLIRQDHSSLLVPFFLQHISQKTGYTCLTFLSRIPLHFEGSGTEQETMSVEDYAREVSLQQMTSRFHLLQIYGPRRAVCEQVAPDGQQMCYDGGSESKRSGGLPGIALHPMPNRRRPAY